ncbi:MAG: serine/threonine protein kinase [Bacteroidales bacterium]|nr:serine/threonine protein kinase [Bacteroidales bacterium]
MYSDESSSFFSPDDPALPEALPMKRIPGSTNGICALFRIEKSGKRRVLKCLETRYRGLPAYEALLRKEYEIGYSLSNPYICEVYSFLEYPGLGRCIEMEWIDGIPLEEYLKTTFPTDDQKLRLLNQLFDAVSYFHSKQVVHKDLKPSNLLVTHNGANIKIIDFGFADNDAYSILKLSAGTEKYAAPELIAGGTVDNRADIWSLGKILLLFGKRWRRAARKCLCEDPAARYGSVEELRRAVVKPRPWQNWIPAVILLLAALLFFLLLRPDNRATPEITPAVEVPTVTVPEGSATPASAVPPTPAAPARQTIRKAPEEAPSAAETENTVASEVDRIVKEATGLFKQKTD